MKNDLKSLQDKLQKEKERSKHESTRNKSLNDEMHAERNQCQSLKEELREERVMRELLQNELQACRDGQKRELTHIRSLNDELQAERNRCQSLISDLQAMTNDFESLQDKLRKEKETSKRESPVDSSTSSELSHRSGDILANVKARTYEADGRHEKDLSVFQNESDRREMALINVGERVLFDALESPDYLEAMCNALVDKIRTQDLKDMLLSLTLLSGIRIEDIESENRYDLKEMRRKLLAEMRLEQGARLTPRIFLNMTFSHRTRKTYDDLCGAFLQHLRLKQNMHNRRNPEDYQEKRDVEMGCSNLDILPEHEDIQIDKKNEIFSPHEDRVRTANVESPGANYHALLHGDKYPLEKITECVGPEGKTLYIGGCSVTFPLGCFDQTQEVSVTAEINPSLWPDGKMGVTPILDINAHFLKKKAKVILTTWYLPDDEAENTMVEVLHFDEKRKGSTQIHHCSVNASRIIEFETRYLTKLGAFLRNVGSPNFTLQSIVYNSKKDFAVAIILDNETIRKKCHEDMKARFANPRVKAWDFNVFSCTKKDSVYSLLFCDLPGFDFDPPERFQHQISDVFKCQRNSIAYSVLHSTNETQEIRIKYMRSKNELDENQAFRYHWNLGESTVSRQTGRPCPDPGNGNLVAGMVNYGNATIINQGYQDVIIAPTTRCEDSSVQDIA